MPHLSLLYGFYARSLKEQIIGTVPTFLSVQFTASAVTLFRVEGSSPTDWRKVQLFAFSGHDKQEPSDRLGMSLVRRPSLDNPLACQTSCRSMLRPKVARLPLVHHSWEW